MPQDPITVTTTAAVPRKEAWHYYTEAEHVINWNFPSEEWHCPAAKNDLREGGRFTITMAAKDGSMELDLEGTYDEIRSHEYIAYTLDTGRSVSVEFDESGEGTGVKVIFEPDPKRGRDEERDSWQGILDQYRTYVEAQPA